MRLTFNPPPGIPAGHFDWVHASINRMTDKSNHERGFMSLCEGQWQLDIDVPAAVLASYGFLAGTGPRPTKILPWEVERNHILRGPAAPDTSAFDQAQPQPLQALTIAGRACWYYLPEAETPPLATLTVLDGQNWQALPGALRRLGLNIAVVGIPATSRADRQQSLGWNPEFLSAIEADIVTLPGPHILAGQSLGGMTALLGGEPGHPWAHTLAQSPSLWWRPDNRTSPADWQVPEWVQLSPGNCTVTQAGSLENPMSTRVPALGLPHREYCGGHDMAWWRVGLIDFLLSLDLDG